MFYIIYYKKINNYWLNETSINKKNILTCTFCLEEDDSELFYDYNFKNNKYLHYCECKPNIHYECFKKVIKNNNSCIICNEQIIDENTSSIKYMKNFLKYSLIFIIFYELLSIVFFFLYNHTINFTYIEE